MRKIWLFPATKTGFYIKDEEGNFWLGYASGEHNSRTDRHRISKDTFLALKLERKIWGEVIGKKARKLD